MIGKEGDPFFDVGPGFKKKSPSSTYSMQNRSNRVPDKKVLVLWLTNCPVDLGELSLHANWGLLSTRAVHLSFSVLGKATINNRNSTGSMMSPCLTPNLKCMDVFTLPMMILNMFLLYMHLIADHSLGSAPYFLVWRRVVHDWRCQRP